MILKLGMDFRGLKVCIVDFIDVKIYVKYLSKTILYH